MFNQKSKTLIVIIVFLIFSNINIFSQSAGSDSTNLSIQNKNYVFDFYFINGYALGYRIISNTNSEIRLLFDLAIFGNTSEEDKTEKSIYDNIKIEKYPSSLKKNYHSISISSQYLIDILKSKDGKVYFGFGPKIGYNWRNNATNFTYNKQKNDNSNSSIGFSLELVGLIGIRSKLTQSISLYLETQLSGGKKWETTEYESTTVGQKYNYKYSTTTDSNEWLYSLVFSKIGLRFRL